MAGTIVHQNADESAIDNWALVSAGIVTNLIEARLDFIQNISQSYDFAVDISVSGQNPKIGDAYNNNNDTFAPVVVIPALSIAKQQNLQRFNVALQAYSDSYFTQQTQFRFFVLYYAANQLATLKPNRAAYIAPIFDWMNSIISYAATYMASVNSQSDAATVVAMTWDLTQISSPPAISLAGAISISN